MNEENNETLKIEQCKFRYKESETRYWDGYYIFIGGDNPSYKENNYKGIKEMKPFVNEDYYISKLKELLKEPSIENSLKIWKTMCEASSYILFARYIPNKDFKKKNPHQLSFHSRIVHLLRKHAWIPDQEGNFYKPSDISSETIHNDFKWNNGNGWLDEIGLSETTKQYENQQHKRRELAEREKAAKTLGFTIEEIEIFTKYKKVIEDRIGKFVDIFETQNN